MEQCNQIISITHIWQTIMLFTTKLTLSLTISLSMEDIHLDLTYKNFVQKGPLVHHQAPPVSSFSTLTITIRPKSLCGSNQI